MNTNAGIDSTERSSAMSGKQPTATSVMTPIVYVVDDDLSVRESLEMLIADAGWQPQVFDSAELFLAHPLQRLPSCLVLDVSLPNVNGLELQAQIADRTTLPIIFITGHGDIPMSVRAMKAGAVEFLTKPFSPEVLLSAIRGAIERSRASLDQEADLQALRTRYASLTVRERQVMALVVRGQLNKQVGGDLGISEITVKAHRGRVMRKMAAGSLVELVSIAARLKLTVAGSELRSGRLVHPVGGDDCDFHKDYIEQGIDRSTSRTRQSAGRQEIRCATHRRPETR